MTPRQLARLKRSLWWSSGKLGFDGGFTMQVSTGPPLDDASCDEQWWVSWIQVWPMMAAVGVLSFAAGFITGTSGQSSGSRTT